MKREPKAVELNGGWMAFYTEDGESYPIPDKEGKYGGPDSSGRVGVPVQFFSTQKEAIAKAAEYIKELEGI